MRFRATNSCCPKSNVSTSHLPARSQMTLSRVRAEAGFSLLSRIHPRRDEISILFLFFSVYFPRGAGGAAWRLTLARARTSAVLRRRKRARARDDRSLRWHPSCVVGRRRSAGAKRRLHAVDCRQLKQFARDPPLELGQAADAAGRLLIWATPARTSQVLIRRARRRQLIGEPFVGGGARRAQLNQHKMELIGSVVV